MLKILIFLLALQSQHSTANVDFNQWKKKYFNRAIKRGISKKVLEREFKNVSVDYKVIEKDKNQIILSSKKDYKKFIKRWMRSDPDRIEQAKSMLKKHKKLLQKIESEYGVDKEVIVSLWGVETLFGKITGDYDLIQSLATLAYEGRRRKFFEIQLNASLRMIMQGHVKREDLKGSWAGATGQCQFMPSNFNVYAQDYDEDGKKDIWTNRADVFASIANFLKKVGWKRNSQIGSLAFLPRSANLREGRVYSIDTYKKNGVKIINQDKYQTNWTRRRYSSIPMKNSPVVLQGGNYKPLMKWNRSSLFAALNIILVDELKSMEN